MNSILELQPDFCPYQGLEPFTEADRDYFVGRDADTRLIASNLLGVPLSVLYGVSGVGKSSVLLAGVLPRLRKNSGLAVTVFRHWQSDEFAVQIKQEIAAAVSANTRAKAQLNPSQPFDEFLCQCNAALDGPVFLIFDQWEEYFLYHPTENEFDRELARAISRRDVTAHFLFAMREEELSKLDRFRTSIPNVLGNMLRLKHLDTAAAEAAIRQPLDVYNRRIPANRRVVIEDSLVNSLIEKSARRDEQESHLTQRNGLVNEKSQIATPVLQLLLTRLWNEERRQQATALRAATLERLGGAQNVVDEYFEDVVQQLPEDQRQLAGRTFGYLVTPAGGKLAQTPATLARWAKVHDEIAVYQLLDGLAIRSNIRILRKIAGHPDRFEIFHDILGPSILKWQQKIEQEQAEKLAREEAEKLAREEAEKLTLQQVYLQTTQSVMASMSHNLGSRLSALPILLARYRLHEAQWPDLHELNQSFENVIKDAFTVIQRSREKLAGVTLRRAWLNLTEVLERALQAALPTENYRIIPAGQRFEISADSYLLGLALAELLQNSKDAVSDESMLRVEVSLSFEITLEGKTVKIIYHDNGPGVPDHLKKTIFEDFFSSHPGGKAGTGLGLGYIRRVVEAHGGDIEERGIFGEGASFVITLPVAEPQDEPIIN